MLTSFASSMHVRVAGGRTHNVVAATCDHQASDSPVILPYFPSSAGFRAWSWSPPSILWERSPSCRSCIQFTTTRLPASSCLIFRSDFFGRMSSSCSESLSSTRCLSRSAPASPCTAGAYHKGRIREEDRLLFFFLRFLVLLFLSIFLSPFFLEHLQPGMCHTDKMFCEIFICK